MLVTIAVELPATQHQGAETTAVLLSHPSVGGWVQQGDSSAGLF